LKGEAGHAQCTAQIVRAVYQKFCSTPNYTNCPHFAKLYGGLKSPFEWLQMDAVEKSKLTEENE